MATDIRAQKKASLIFPANDCVSKSVSNAMAIAENLPRRLWIKSHWLWFSERGINFASSSALAKSAFAARSLASAAPAMASATFLSDRTRNSVWMRPSHIPNRTSPTMPNAIATSVIANSVRNVLYGGLIQAMISSAITATTTTAPQRIPHRSHDDDPFSKSPSVAFIVPFGKYQGGKGSFITFLMSIIFWSLVLGLILWFAYR